MSPLQQEYTILSGKIADIEVTWLEGGPYSDWLIWQIGPCVMLST